MLGSVSPQLSMALDQLLTAAVSFFTASIVLTLWRASTTSNSSTSRLTTLQTADHPSDHC